MINFIFDLLAQLFLLGLKTTSFFHMSVFVSKIPFAFGNKLRYCFYKKTLNQVGNNVVFSYGTIFTHREISIGNNVRFGPYDTIGLVDFGNDIIIGQYVHFLSGKNQHSYDKRDVVISRQGGNIQKILIDDDIWIGTGSIILASVSKGNVVAAGSIVTKKFDEYSVVGGNPAKLIKNR